MNQDAWCSLIEKDKYMLTTDKYSNVTQSRRHKLKITFNIGNNLMHIPDFHFQLFHISFQSLNFSFQEIILTFELK
jgi:hypothetical protein